MEKALFDDLVQSLKEAKAIARGEAPAARRFTATPPDVALKPCTPDVSEQGSVAQRFDPA
ncbi:MAG: hypothetical protein LBI59_08965 [Candidatus Accumulibacter sp.]|nr:hypothetical protein [Accumulibacter sp.]